MNYLIKNALIVCNTSPHHMQRRDITVVNGKIDKIGKKLTITKGKIIEGSDLHVSLGLCDIGTHSGEPGHEYRETIHSLSSAALRGGYTMLAIMPDTKPITQSKADIQYLIQHTDRQGVAILPIGALSKDLKGANFTEYIDMHEAGAVAFSDGLRSVTDSGLLTRSLQYASQKNKLIIHHPYDKAMADGGHIHEDVTSTTMGLKGIPSCAEYTMVYRDLSILEYAGGRLMEHAISTERSVALIKAAKKDKQNLYSSVAALNLLHTDEDMIDFDTHLKVKPVLRTKADQKALIKGLKEGTIDVIVSNHHALDEEVKNLEFTYAEPGANVLETIYVALIHSLYDEVGVERLIDALTTAPRRILGLATTLDEGYKADLTIIDRGAMTTIMLDTLQSLSKNNPHIDKTFGAQVLMTLAPH
jgi:dihydroorotase